MLLIGYFEGIHSERGIVWRCSDSLSLREFLRLTTREKVPDYSRMSKTRSRLPHEVHDQIFAWVLGLVADHDLVKAERIGVDGSTMEANAALRTIDYRGGLDPVLLKAKDELLSAKALKIKRTLKAKLAETAAA